MSYTDCLGLLLNHWWRCVGLERDAPNRRTVQRIQCRNCGDVRRNLSRIICRDRSHHDICNRDEHFMAVGGVPLTCPVCMVES